MSSVNRYRVYCENEKDNIYIWDTSPPTFCPNYNTHIINNDSIVIVDQVNTSQTEITNLTSDNTQVLQTAQKNVIINLSSFFGVSTLRNNVITSGSGNASNNPATESEIKLNCSGSDDSIALRSIERGIYISGLTCEIGIALRIPNNNLTGNQILKWGYFSNQNGFYYKLTSTDFQVCILNNSVETCISRANFNGDRLDSNGKSNNNLDFSKGNVFKIIFSWYGFGLVSFQIQGYNKTSNQANITLHEYQTVGRTSTRIPNLPIQIILSNNGTVANTNVYVAGRQFSILGNFEPTLREISMYKYLCSLSHDVFLPILSIKRISEFTGCTVKLSSIIIKSSVDCEVKIVTNALLSSSSWVKNPHASESACLVDASSTNYSDGIIIHRFICFAGNITKHSLNNIQLNELLPITIISKSLTGENGSITCNLSWNEYW